MSAVQDCPLCKLVNPPSAERCDCGFDFVTRSLEASYLGKRGPGGDLTALETAIIFLVPPFAIYCGFVARQQGRVQSGNKMVIAGMMVLLTPLLVAAVYMLVW